ncbi:hypothetical protein [Mesoterricola sediminis]|uniref:Uncharacterized protein n=1 Tax=Mesoterricola sediminis TaxID=2927980 RepID=A0AA48GZC9_9BACT|nr:hypothetical protein [Mesoterricola sediminis]BDU78415.1 hypothetical protein METESE_33730 [Mesoterricola sediminis]
MSNPITKPETDRLSLTLTKKTIRDLRLLAAFRDWDNHTLVEDLLQRAGLSCLVAEALNREAHQEASPTVVEANPHKAEMPPKIEVTPKMKVTPKTVANPQPQRATVPIAMQEKPMPMYVEMVPEEPPKVSNPEAGSGVHPDDEDIPW